MFDKPQLPDVEQFVGDGLGQVDVHLAAQPYRGVPSWDDLKAAAEAILRHIHATWGALLNDLNLDPETQTPTELADPVTGTTEETAADVAPGTEPALVEKSAPVTSPGTET
jgi:hypothetical protein